MIPHKLEIQSFIFGILYHTRLYTSILYYILLLLYYSKAYMSRRNEFHPVDTYLHAFFHESIAIKRQPFYALKKLCIRKMKSLSVFSQRATRLFSINCVHRWVGGMVHWEKVETETYFRIRYSLCAREDCRAICNAFANTRVRFFGMWMKWIASTSAKCREILFFRTKCVTESIEKKCLTLSSKYQCSEFIDACSIS